VGDISDVALRDRRRLSEDGVLIIVATVNGDASSAQPELIARGFPETEPVLEETRAEAARVLRELLETDTAEIKLMQEHLHDAVGQLIYDRTGRRPLILPVVVEV
jgi:ribonuclease J